MKISALCVIILSFVAAYGQDKYEGCPSTLVQNSYLRIHNGDCFQFNLASVMNWNSANFDCLQTGGHLAVIRSLAENDFIVASLADLSFTTSDAWIGLSYDSTRNRNMWKWASGEKIGFFNWATEQPSMDECAVIQYENNGKWHTSQCTANKVWICEYRKFNPQILTSVPIGCEEKSNEMVVLSCFLPQNTPLSVYWHEEFSNGSSVLLWEGDYISRLDPYNFKYQDRTYNISVTKGDNYKCTVKSYHLEFMVDKLYLQYGEEYSTNMSDVCLNVFPGECEVSPHSSFYFEILKVNCTNFKTFLGNLTFTVNVLNITTGNLEVISSSENGYFDVLVLPAGEEENDYAYNITIHVNVTGYEEGSTHLTEVKIIPLHLADGKAMIRLIDCTVKTLMEVNNYIGLTNFASAVMDMLNEETEEDKSHLSEDEDIMVRDKVCGMLADLPVEDFETLEKITEAIYKTTWKPERLSDKAQNSLLTCLGNVTGYILEADLSHTNDTEKFRSRSKSVLDSVGNLFDVEIEKKKRTNPFVDNINIDEEKESEKNASDPAVVRRVKKIMKIVDDIGVAMFRSLPDNTPTQVELVTKTMNLVVGLTNNTNGSLIHSSRILNGKSFKGSFQIPNLANHSNVDDQPLLQFKMLYIDKNPFTWHKSADLITSPMLSLTFPEIPKKIEDLQEPVMITLPNYDYEFSVNFVKLHCGTYNDDKKNFLRISVEQPANQSFMINLMTNAARFGIELRYDINMESQVNITGAKNGMLLEDTNPAIIKEPGNETITWSIGVLVIVHNKSACNSNITVKVLSSTISCQYWDAKNETWSGHGCEVSPLSTPYHLLCSCNHLTEFAAGFFIMPNSVDPIQDALLFLTFFENPVIVMTVLLLWMLYIVGIYWTRKTDRKDSTLPGIMIPFPSDLAEPYKYLICVVTTWRFKSTTTSKVSCYIKGSKGNSAKHCLSVPGSVLFQAGAEDWFLITSSYNLGEPEKIVLWHDNSGFSPSWHLSRIVIEDLQSRKVFHFHYEDWLGQESGNTKVILTRLSASGITKYGNELLLKASRDLRRDHLWISIMCKPSSSEFTRTQRLSCALCLLLCVMLSCLMFHGISTSNSSIAEEGVPVFEISLSDIIIGIQNAIIMVPINILIMELFLRTRPKISHTNRYIDLHKVISDADDNSTLENNRHNDNSTLENNRHNVKKNDNSTLENNRHNDNSTLENNRHNEKKNDNSNLENNRHNDNSTLENNRHNEKKNDNSTLENNRHNEKKNKNGGQCMLPWWNLYIAWTILILTSLISSYFVMLYGLKYGYNESLQWLISFLTAFVMDVFIFEPFKLMAVAMLFICLLGRPVKFIDTPALVNQESDDIINRKSAGLQHQHETVIPMYASQKIHQIKVSNDLQEKMKTKISDILINIFFTLILLFVVHNYRSVESCYLQSKSVENMFIQDEFVHMRVSDDFWDYLNTPVIDKLERTSSYDREDKTEGSEFLLLGAFRLRQIRTERGSCPEKLRKLFTTDIKCASSSSNDRRSYNRSWNLPSNEIANIDEWTYQSAGALKSSFYIGKRGMYSGGGYTFELKPNESSRSTLVNLTNMSWIDEMTRVIFIEFTLYNPNVNLFSNVIMSVEIASPGNIYTSHQVFTAELYNYVTNIPKLISEAIFFFVTILFACIEIIKAKEIGLKPYMKGFWNKLSMIQLFLCFTMMSIYFDRIFSAEDILKLYRKKTESFLSFNIVIILDFITVYVMAMLVAVTTIKFMKVLTLNSKLKHLISVAMYANKQLTYFFLMFSIILIAFSCCGNLLFGAQIDNFKSIVDSFMSLIQYSVSIANYHMFIDVEPVFGAIFLFLYIFIVVFCFMKVFTVIILNAFTSLRKDGIDDSGNEKLFEYISNYIRRMLR